MLSSILWFTCAHVLVLPLSWHHPPAHLPCRSLQALQGELQAVGEQLRQMQQARTRDSYWRYSTMLLATSASAVAYLYWRRAHRP
jgi:hypothetical protein